MKLSSQNITVKSIIVKRFELNLKQTPKGKYYIEHSLLNTHGLRQGDLIPDYKTASHAFEAKFIELEGN